MRNFLPLLFSKHKTSKAIRTGLLLIVLTLGTARFTFGQEATFFENFDETELGSLPEGWTWYQTGGIDPSRRWITSRYGFFGSNVAWSNWGDGALEGEVDEDWLITPQITPAEGDHLIFDGAQEFVWDDFGSEMHILISTTSAEPESFTHTLATFTETEFPGYLYSETIKLSLSEFENTPIYIAFVHKNPSSDFDTSEDFYLDNIWVRNILEATFYKAEIQSQNTNPVPVGVSATQILLGIKVTVQGDNGTVDATSFNFSTEGTTDPSHISEARLYTTGSQSFIATYDEEGTVDATLFGTTALPGDNFDVSGNATMTIGDNFFWLILVVDPEVEPIHPFPELDASLKKIVVEEVEHQVEEGSEEGAAVIVPSHPVNDSIEHAIPLAAEAARYGSYNTRATFEPEVEKLAYCAPGGVQDVFNTIWWKFIAPGNGFITADLTPTEFNTVLVFQRKEDFMQLACNDDIDAAAGIVQSRISDFPVTKGEEIYIRASGVGNPGDPNGPAGIVLMDFSFTTLLATGDKPESNTVSHPYPNPARDVISLDITLLKKSPLKIVMLDMVGRGVVTRSISELKPGAKHTVKLDCTTLSSGAYLLKVKGNNFESSQKVIINK